MKYLLVNPRKMRPPLSPETLNRLFREEEPPTVRRPDLAAEWAKRMNSVLDVVQKEQSIR